MPEVGDVIKLAIRNGSKEPRTNDWATTQIRCKVAPRVGATDEAWFEFAHSPNGEDFRLLHVRVSRIEPWEKLTVQIPLEAEHGQRERAMDLIAPRVHGVPPMPQLELTRGGEQFVGIFDVVPRRGTYDHYGARQVACICNLGGGATARLWIRRYKGSPTFHWAMNFSFCDIVTTADTMHIDELSIIWPSDLTAQCDHATARGVTTKADRMVLLQNTWLGFGQAPGWRGRLLDLGGIEDVGEYRTAAANMECELFMAEDKGKRFDFGPKGMSYRRPASEPLHRALDLRFSQVLHDSFRPGNVFDSPVYYEGVANTPPQGGDQEGFGLIKAMDVLDGRPQNLHWWWPSVLRELGRPQFWYNMDGWILTQRERPGLKYWDWQPHYHPGISDQLGKVAWKPRPWNRLQSMDWAHSGIVHVCAIAAITGDPLANHMVSSYAHTLFGMHGSFGEARGWGRGLLSMAWCHYAGEKTMMRELLERLGVDGVWQRTLERNHPHQRRPFEIKTKHPRWGAEFTMPWQEGHFVSGAQAALLEIGADPELRRLCLEAADSVVLHESAMVDGDMRTVWALDYNGGKAPERLENADGTPGYADTEASRALLTAAAVSETQKADSYADWAERQRSIDVQKGDDDWSDWMAFI